MANFDKVRNTKVYEVIINQLKEKICFGELSPGDSLPTERTLAEKMGVSRASVREALKVLEYIGLVESRPGGGTSISQIHPDLIIEKLNSLSVSENETLLLDLIELREVLEPKIVELAAVRATNKEIEEIGKRVESLKNNAAETINAENDAMFHLAVARASHNVFFTRILETMYAMLNETRERTLSISRERRKILEEHREIIKNIKKHDKEGARKAIEFHIRNIKSFIEKRL